MGCSPACSVSCAASAFFAILSGVHAQNGSNYHILANGVDAVYAGIGAGGAQTQADGLGTWIPGEDLKGSHLVAFSGDFGYRMAGFREIACPIKNPVGGGPLAIKLRGLLFAELDGLNGNNQAVFLNPACPLPGPSFPLGGSAGAIPYGAGPGSTLSFLVAGLPAGVGPAPSAAILLPNNGLLPSTAGGTATLVANASNVSLPINSSGFCWGVHFAWLPSAVALTDDIDGLWHYVINSEDGNQYWAMSNDEMNLWQSNSVASDAGLTVTVAFPANVDYTLLLTSVEPNTITTLAPRGLNLQGPYYNQTENVGNEFGVSINPNAGFDVGRGSAAISLSGTAGVPNPTSGLGNQNPLNNPGTLTTLGFLTWDNGGDQDGSVRVTWISLDYLGLARGNPALDPGVTKLGGLIRLPVVSALFAQPLTITLLPLFGHVTVIGSWPDPSGFPSGGTFPLFVAGASSQLPVGPLPAACTGTKLNLTYGTSGRQGTLGAPGPLTFDPSIADTSGTKELYLFD